MSFLNAGAFLGPAGAVVGHFLGKANDNSSFSGGSPTAADGFGGYKGKPSSLPFFSGRELENYNRYKDKIDLDYNMNKYKYTAEDMKRAGLNPLLAAAQGSAGGTGSVTGGSRRTGSTPEQDLSSVVGAAATVASTVATAMTIGPGIAAAQAGASASTAAAGKSAADAAAIPVRNARDQSVTLLNSARALEVEAHTKGIEFANDHAAENFAIVLQKASDEHQLSQEQQSLIMENVRRVQQEAMTDVKKRELIDQQIKSLQAGDAAALKKLGIDAHSLNIDAVMGGISNAVRLFGSLLHFAAIAAMRYGVR